MTSWLLGAALGGFVGGLGLEIGTLVVLLLLPALVWAARERGRPLGLGGVFVGIGVAVAALIAWSDARCDADPSCHLAYDPAPWFVFAAVLVATGAVVTGVAWWRRRDATAGR